MCDYVYVSVCAFVYVCVCAGADLGISEFLEGGGADFLKKFKNFVDLFFRSTNLIF